MFCFLRCRRKSPKSAPEDKEPAQSTVEGECRIVPFGDTFMPLTSSAATTYPPRAQLNAKPPTLRRSGRFDHQCVVCSHNLPIMSFARTTQSCRHELDICLICLRRWLETEGVITQLTWNILSCPSQECPGQIQHSDMKRLCSQKLFKRYDRCATRSVLNTIPNFQYCRLPGCDSGQEFIPTNARNASLFVCHTCGYRWCVEHDVAWHEGQSCEVYGNAINVAKRAAERKASKKVQRQEKEEAASAKYLNKKTQVCPGHGCGVPIRRSSGCPMMKCAKCGHKFCWVCLAPIPSYPLETIHLPQCNRYGNIKPLAWRKD